MIYVGGAGPLPLISVKAPVLILFQSLKGKKFNMVGVTNIQPHGITG